MSFTGVPKQPTTDRYHDLIALGDVHASAFFGIDPSDDDYRSLLGQRVFAVVEEQWDAVFHEDESERRARQYTDELAIPVMEYVSRITDELAVDLDHWAENLYRRHYQRDGEDDLGRPKRPDYDVSLDHPSFRKLQEGIKDIYQRDDFDIIIGIHPNGTPVFSAIYNVFNADELHLRYSKFEDNDVRRGTMTQQELDQLCGESVLMVDDVLSQKITANTVGNEPYQNGAESVDFVSLPFNSDVSPHWLHDKTLSLIPINGDSDDGPT